MPEKKGAGGHPCLFCQKARILSDFAQIITDFGYVKDVVAKLDSFVEQDRNQLVEPSFESGSASTSSVSTEKPSSEAIGLSANSIHDRDDNNSATTESVVSLVGASCTDVGLELCARHIPGLSVAQAPEATLPHRKPHQTMAPRSPERTDPRKAPISISSKGNPYASSAPLRTAPSGTTTLTCWPTTAPPGFSTRNSAGVLQSIFPIFTPPHPPGS